MQREYVAAAVFVSGFGLSGIALYGLFTRAGTGRTGLLTLLATFGLAIMVGSLLIYVNAIFGASPPVDESPQAGASNSPRSCPECGGDRHAPINVEDIYRCKDCGRVFAASDTEGTPQTLP